MEKSEEDIQLPDVDSGLETGQDCAMLDQEEKETSFGNLTFAEEIKDESVNKYWAGKSFSLYASFLGLGLISSVVGPTIVSMEVLFDTDAGTIARALVGGGVGYLSGSLVCALCFDRFNPEIQFTLAMVLQGSCMASAPFSGNVYAYIVLCSLCAVGMGFVDSAGNSYGITLWNTHKFKGPLLQGIHAVWSLGATLGPIIIRPFLTNLNSNDALNTTNGTSFSATPEDVEFTRYAYVTISSISLVCAIVFFVLLILQRPPCLASKAKQYSDDQNTWSRGQIEKKCHIATLLFMLVIHFHVIVFVEGCTGSFIAPFVVKHLGWTNKNSALIAAVFQGSLGFGRVVNIGIAAVLTPRAVLIMNLSATLCAYILACFLAYGNSILWISIALAGFFQSSSFPTSVLWASDYIQVSGTAAGFFLLGSSSASFIYPNLVGYFFDNGTPMYMLYMILAVAIIQIFVFIFMQAFAFYASKRAIKDREDKKIRVHQDM